MAVMLELVNLSNDPCDLQGLLGGDPLRLEHFLQQHGLAGIEFMPCAPWDGKLPFPACIQGVHLRFWPNWLDFWQWNIPELRREVGNAECVRAVYGETRQDWLGLWRQNVREAVRCGAQYVVFHVADARTSELYCRRFFHRDEEVVRAAAAVVNAVMEGLPEECMLLFENLWWPGLTFCEPPLAQLLLELTEHQNSGFMLDTGHLMNTNLSLRTEQEGMDYVIRTVEKMGVLRERIRGIHLHCSLSGAYVEAMRRTHPEKMDILPDWQQVMDYILHTDQHRPFVSGVAEPLLADLRPDWLVHEFIPASYADWETKVSCQRHSLQWE